MKCPKCGYSSDFDFFKCSSCGHSYVNKEDIQKPIEQDEVVERIPCFIPNSPLSGMETYQDIFSAGAFKGGLRKAKFHLGSKRIKILAEVLQTNYESKQKDLAECSLLDIKKISIKDFPESIQLREAIKGFIGGSIGLSIALIIGVLIKLGKIDGTRILYSLIGGIVLSFLMFFLPKLFKIEQNLKMISFMTIDGPKLSIICRQEEWNKIQCKLEEKGLPIDV